MFSIVFGLLISAVWLSGCQWIAGYEDFSGSEPAPCASLRKTKIGARKQTLVRIDIPRGSCFWIDKYEVTVREYEAWLGDLSDDFDDWDDRCQPWKSELGPSDPGRNSDDPCRDGIGDSEDAFGQDKPIRCVDFCDAEAFCRLSGDERGHLCWDNNASTPNEPEGKPAQWEFACSNSGTSTFPWGNDQDLLEEPERICNVNQAGEGDENNCNGPGGAFTCGASDVGAYRDCVTDTGVYDIIGNVAEWVFSCKKANQLGDPTATCKRFGGSYAETLASADCSTIGPSVAVAKDTRAPDLGFRCCVELTAAEELELQ